jgi:hypothetical protein
MKRYDFAEDQWPRYTEMMGWLIEHYGQSEHWTWTWFEPKRIKPDAQWYIGTHRTKWYRSRGQTICVWMPDNIYTFFIIRFS